MTTNLRQVKTVKIDGTGVLVMAARREEDGMLLLLRSDDNGETWDMIGEVEVIQDTPPSLAYINDHDCRLILSYFDADGAHRTWWSTDSGLHWNLV